MLKPRIEANPDAILGNEMPERILVETELIAFEFQVQHALNLHPPPLEILGPGEDGHHRLQLDLLAELMARGSELDEIELLWR